MQQQTKKRKADNDVQDNEVSSTTGWPNMNAAAASDSGGGNVASGGGGANMPIPLAPHLGQRKVDSVTLISSGTTWIPAGTSNTTSDAVWCKFPWELISDHINDWFMNEKANQYAFWKCTGVSLQIKNPVCVADVGTTAAGLVQAGMNNQAQIFGYMDTNYVMGVHTNFGLPGNTGVFTKDFHEQLVASWTQHGYYQGGVKTLPSTAIPRSYFSSSFPDTKQMGMGPGAEMSFSWPIHSPYWRSTEEFYQTAHLWDNVGTYQDFLNVRADEYRGVIAVFNNGYNEQGFPHPMSKAYMLDPRSRFLKKSTEPWNWIGLRSLGDNDAGSGQNVPPPSIALPDYHIYCDPNPIPSLWFQLQPQIQSITTGLANSSAQIQFELHFDMKFTGRAPPIGRSSLTTARADIPAKNWLAYAENRATTQWPLTTQTLNIFTPLCILRSATPL